MSIVTEYIEKLVPAELMRNIILLSRDAIEYRVKKKQ